ncbi:DsbA family oxidoreductase [Thermomonospora cellulosilytica]|uniref:Putative DsbA family dithiol-disulfide isomerase n=1 Tax=Thermomonospora cellulosilytica TaxID=1411118 RepID=A0A7W3MV26_9ACTN|nr:DsbA family oxidoreductase [Thermomonospora cellulosilytica]MBA9002362.1 putative DsbA family dithiol-disulfide isomerase [Thermomonospora cellulosilytica]
MNVEIYSDVVCPWCYLGQARFRAAVARFGGDVRVTWRPFQLDPAAPATVRPAGEVLAEKFGGPEQVAAAHDRLRALTAAEGLPFAPEKSLSINTRDAHRVIGLAGTAGVQDAVVERFFRAHHAEGRNLADAGTLAELAAEAGLDAAAVRDLLETDQGVAEVEEQGARARALGIGGVPFFLFEGQWGVSGAQSTEILESALRQVADNIAS